MTILLVNVSVSQAIRTRACDNIHQSGVSHPLQGLSDSGDSGDTGDAGDKRVDGPDGMHSVQVRACNGCGVSVSFSRRCKRLPTARVREQPQRVKRTSMIRWCGQGRSSRDYSVPCRLLHETPAQAQGRCGWPGGWSVLAILPADSVPT